MTPEEKPTVYYNADFPSTIRAGRAALIVPLAHPSPYVTGDGKTVARTSEVIAHNTKTGEFWTKNTHYVPRYRLHKAIKGE